MHRQPQTVNTGERLQLLLPSIWTVGWAHRDTEGTLTMNCEYKEVHPGVWSCSKCNHVAVTSGAPKRHCGPKQDAKTTVNAPRQERATYIPVKQTGRCKHLGSEIRKETCKTCQSGTGKPFVTVYECALHSECTLNNTSIHPRPKACSTCRDRRNTGDKSVVIIWPWLGMGGAERWLVSMASALPAVSKELGVNYKVSAVVVTEPSSIDRDMHDELSRWTRVVVHRNGLKPSADVDDVVRGADVVIVGGTTETSHLLSARRGLVAFVAHGACSVTTSAAKAAAESGNVDYYTAVSNASKDIFPEELRPKVTVIENGAEIARCTPFQSREEVREKWGLKPHEKAIGYIGRFSPDKRWESIPEAIAALPSEYVAVMVGNDNEQVRRYCEEVSPGRIVFPGRVNLVGSALVGLDRWVNVSPAEGFCLSRIEAALAGIPVVSTPTGDLESLESKYGKQSWTVPVGASGAEIADVIAQSFREPEETLLRSATARQVAFRDYTSQAMASRWIRYLENL